MVTHANLLHNCGVIADALELDDTTVGAGWLPHFHDMGLVGMLLTAVYVGADLVFMSPISFLRRPIRWLQAIDRYGATATVAPNFSYELLARRVSDDDLAGLDLSTLRVALNGAEPIRPHVLDAVIARLGAAGFRPDAFVAGYGMAEVTLLASASPVARPPRYLDVDPDALERHEVIASGADGASPAGEQRTATRRGPADRGRRDTGRVLPEARVGEIWLRGPSVAAGYLNRDEENAEKFDAHTADGDGTLPAHRRPRRDGRRRALRHRAAEGPADRQRAQPLPAGHRGGGREDPPGAGHGAGRRAQRRRRPGAHRGDPRRRRRRPGRHHPRGADRADQGTVARMFDVPAPSVVLVKRSAIHRTTSGKVQRRSMLAAFMANGVDGLVAEAIDPAVQRVRASAGASGVTA